MAVTERREIVVVGAGLLGLFTAYELSSRRHDVVCLERDAVGHAWSGSKGRSRIFRLGYTDPLYVFMALSARRLWQELEETFGKTFVSPVGFCSFGQEVPALRRAMAAAGADAVLLSEREARRRFPALMTTGHVVFEEDAGVIAAGAVLSALCQVVPEVRQHTEVTALDESSDGIRIATTGGSIDCSIAVLCGGPWSAQLGRLARIAGLQALSPSLQQLAYFRMRPSDLIPSFVERGGRTLFGLPDLADGAEIPGAAEGARYKLGIHEPGGKVEPGRADPGFLAQDVDWLSAAARRVLPGLDAVPTSVERCSYDNSPDGDFVVDRVGRIVVGAGTSGHGFKFGPLLGAALADLAEAGRPASPFAGERFALDRAALRLADATRPGAKRPAL